MRFSTSIAFVLIVAALGADRAAAWSWPVRGPVLKPFVAGGDPYAAGQHRGVDVGADAAEGVLAPASGTVSFVGTVPSGGKTVTIETAGGLSVTLVRLAGYSVRKGDEVREGAAVGGAGVTSGAEWPRPYVHLGIRRTADKHGYVDPLTLLPVRSTPPPVASPPAPGASPRPVAAPIPQGGVTAPRPGPAVPRPVPVAAAPSVGSAAAASAPTEAPAPAPGGTPVPPVEAAASPQPAVLSQPPEPTPSSPVAVERATEPADAGPAAGEGAGPERPGPVDPVDPVALLGKRKLGTARGEPPTRVAAAPRAVSRHAPDERVGVTAAARQRFAAESFLSGAGPRAAGTAGGRTSTIRNEIAAPASMSPPAPPVVRALVAEPTRPYAGRHGVAAAGAGPVVLLLLALALALVAGLAVAAAGVLRRRLEAVGAASDPVPAPVAETASRPTCVVRCRRARPSRGTAARGRCASSPPGDPLVALLTPAKPRGAPPPPYRGRAGRTLARAHAGRRRRQAALV